MSKFSTVLLASSMLVACTATGELDAVCPAGELPCVHGCCRVCHDSADCASPCSPINPHGEACIDQLCVPGCDCLSSCAESRAECGRLPDGCGGVLDCGACGGADSCGGGGIANICGEGTCVPTSCEAEGANCGRLSDGCGDLLECGTCTNPESCHDNICTCEPATCADNAYECGDWWPDGCGGTLDCGGCDEGYGCTEGACVLGCTPNDHLGCHDGDAYWYDSCGSRGDRADECGTSACEAFSDWTCSDPFSTVRERSCVERGCNSGVCFETNSVENEEESCIFGDSCASGTCAPGPLCVSDHDCFSGACGGGRCCGLADGCVVQVSAGNAFTCTLLSTGAVKCWGRGWHGKLGNGTTDDRLVPTPVTGISSAVAIAAGVEHACALLENGTVRCWGENENFQLGDGTSTERTTPVAVSGVSNAVAIGAGYFHTCAVLNNGTVRCWGYNAYGQLGDGTTTDRSSAVVVAGLSGAVEVAATPSSTCARLSGGAVKCWGSNRLGQLGDGTTTNRTAPVSVSGISTAVSLSAGTDTFVCAVLADGTGRCWGSNFRGQLADGTEENRSTPVAVTGLSGAERVVVGKAHACAMLDTGNLQCWGYNNGGPLGDGTTVTRLRATDVIDLPPGEIVDVGAASHTCAVGAAGNVWCWGPAFAGDGTDGTAGLTPVPATGFLLAVD